jgi:hypothetical protein
MADLQKVVFSCPTFSQFVKLTNEIRRALPPEIGMRLVEIVKNYSIKYGLQGAYERMKDRPISQILAEYQAEEAKPIASGEIEGIRYHLYEAPSSQGPDEENASDE